MLAYWLITLLCSSAASGHVIYKETNGSVTLKCSHEGCFQPTDEYDGMYLYNEFSVEEVLYLYGQSNEITPRKRYSGRVESSGPFMNNSITISSLTADDSGVYRCVYTRGSKENTNCSVYMLVVTGHSPFIETPAEENCPQPVALIVILASCVVALLLVNIFFLLVIPKVKERRIRRRQPPPEFGVYEVMTRKSLPPAAGGSTAGHWDSA